MTHLITIKQNLLKGILILTSFIYVNNSVLAYETDSLFKTDVIIKMELRVDFSAIQRDREVNPVYHDGELIYLTPGGDPKKLSVKVRARGIFRRNPINCDFPPLYVDFNNDEVRNTVFESQVRLKLVTPCQDDQDVIDEYLIYKMYNAVTDLSLRVRLVKILYFDTGKGKKVFEKYSFFIEEKEHLAERINAFVKDKFVPPFDLNWENTRRMSVFQYMIGNKDWFFSSRHNLIIMQPNDTTQAPYVIPYDFDFAGFVNANYTKPQDIPDEFLATRRAYQGICYTNTEFNEVFDFYRKLRPAFETMINNMDLLSKYKRQQNLKYLKYFYQVIENSDLIKKEFMDVCETKKTYNIVEK